MSPNSLTELSLLWEERYDRGEEVPLEELCRDCPELVPALRARIHALKQMSWLDRPTDPGGRQEETQRGRAPPDLDRFPHLRLEEVIGEGGYGEVWAGYHCRLRRPVAVKVFRPTRGDQRPWRDKLRYEAEQVASLRHPGIVPVLEMGEGEGWGYLVFPLIPGGNLRQLIRRSGTPTVGQAGRVVADVGMALDYVHGKGVVHRDVKPDNILLDGQGGVYLTDFGVAARKGDLWLRAEIGGTLGYMSPEQIRESEICEQRQQNEDEVATLVYRFPHTDVVLWVDPRMDVWSLGVVLYELLTGRHPFAAYNGAELRQAILARDPEPPAHLNPVVPPAFEHVCLKCLDKNPRRRYETARELATALRCITLSTPAPSCVSLPAPARTHGAGTDRLASMTVLECASGGL
jgi:serine/threonine-protein kinase